MLSAAGPKVLAVYWTEFRVSRNAVSMGPAWVARMEDPAFDHAGIICPAVMEAMTAPVFRTEALATPSAGTIWPWTVETMTLPVLTTEAFA